MTMIEVVAQLQAEGHEVDYYVRKDGGILIKRIDNQRFPQGASGNARAREIVGATISEARIKQLKYATKSRGVEKPKVYDPLYEKWKDVHEKWTKRFKSKKGKPHPAGYLPWKPIAWIRKHKGEKEAWERLERAEQYASGIAYNVNVQHLAFFIDDAGDKYNSPELKQLAQDLLENAFRIKDEWIWPAYQKMYELSHGISPKQIAYETRQILRL